MVWIFWAATIFGCAFLIPMVLGGLDSDIDGFGGEADLGGGIDVDTGMDFGVDVQVDVESGGGLSNIGSSIDGDGGLGPDVDHFDTGGDFGNALGAAFSSLVSFRTLVFFSAFFGTSGLVFALADYSPTVAVGSAVMIGAIAAVANSLLFGLIKSSQPNSQISDRTLEGRPATVVLPMEGKQRGRIRIDLSGQPQYIVARPMDGDEQKFDVGASVVVVKIEDGTAHIASLAELE
ncbi:MAG: hypothetical protein ACR2QK_24005 [Acidimicrobiales bacterium]